MCNCFQNFLEPTLADDSTATDEELQNISDSNTDEFPVERIPAKSYNWIIYLGFGAIVYYLFFHKKKK